MKDRPDKIKKAAALSYEPGEDKAPKVVASGKGVMAEDNRKGEGGQDPV